MCVITTIRRKALAAWKRLVASEQQSLKTSPRFTSRDVVSELLRREIEMLESLGRRDEAVQAMRELVPLESGQPQSLIRLVEWLAQKKAWSVIDDVATRFGQAFDQQPLLMYTLAEARLAQGNRAGAPDRRPGSGVNGDDASEHLAVGRRAAEAGRCPWAEMEFRHVMAAGPLDNALVVDAYHRLAEMFHDQGQDEAAGKTLQAVVDRMDAQPAIAQAIGQTGRKPESSRSRMLYCFSEQERLKGNVRGKRNCWTWQSPAIRPTPTCWWPSTGCRIRANARRRQTLQKIRAAADSFRKEVIAAPENAEHYNQLAWLLGNTLAESDKAVADEALRASQRSLELQPGEGGLMDTLGRCYYARGDYEAAVRHQSEAARLEPHSGLIRRQLELFKKARRIAPEGARREALILRPSPRNCVPPSLDGFPRWPPPIVPRPQGSPVADLLRRARPGLARPWTSRHAEPGAGYRAALGATAIARPGATGSAVLRDSALCLFLAVDVRHRLPGMRADSLVCGALAHGHVFEAWHFNPAGLLLFAVVLYQIPFRAMQLWRLRTGRNEFRHSPWTVAVASWLLVAALVGQWVWRLW